ncbi:DUF1295 domain containing protein [Nitzschia inconspicua]|uniref:DUF1295 domain containing protein n=1 Tax=Nitzschia inconspicua TaxID=303405 RepID=A0A9K3L0E9_9STRA|nr:DUF1295 domain containing protein [Nitzschia inconspicua]
MGYGWLFVAVLPSVKGFVSPGQVTANLRSDPTFSPFHPTTKSLVSPPTNLYAVPPEIWTSFLPPATGFVKSEWTVSYGYGFATSLSALSLLMRTAITPDNPIFPVQATALIFYGLRLNAFLYVRNRVSSRMQEFQKNMEERAAARGSRLSRAPTVLGCGFLYFALYTPLLLTSMISGSDVVPPVSLLAMKGLAALQWCGFLMGAVADSTKTYVKKMEKDENFLVTSGIFSLLRHPNYTGEIIAWTCNFLLGTIAGSYLLRNKFSGKILGYLGLNWIGWVGIVFVLLGATGNLEERQKSSYGNTEKYKKWVDSTWSGWYFPKTKIASEPHAITMDDVVEEERGSGI